MEKTLDQLRSAIPPTASSLRGQNGGEKRKKRESLKTVWALFSNSQAVSATIPKHMHKKASYGLL